MEEGKVIRGGHISCLTFYLVFGLSERFGCVEPPSVVASHQPPAMTDVEELNRGVRPPETDFRSNFMAYSGPLLLPRPPFFPPPPATPL